MNRISRWLLWRELGNGELFLILLALWLAVSFSSGMAIFADRLHRGLTAQSADLMGADLIIRGAQPLNPTWQQQARQLGLRTSESTEFTSMALADEAMQLVAVKAVDAEYPLRGKLELSALPNASHSNTASPQNAPMPGEVWIDSQVWQALALTASSQISLGAKDFKVTRLIVSEPDRGAEFINFSPRVMMNASDLAATELVSAGSRIRWKLALAGSPEQISAFADWVKPQLSPNERMMGVDTQRPMVRNTLIKAEKYLLLSGLLSVVLAGVAIGFSMRRYAQRQTGSIALMKSLGADNRQIRSILLGKFMLLSAAAIVLGLLSGALMQQMIVTMLKDNLPAHLPLPGGKPLLLACATALLLIAGFALPPLLQLIRTPAMRILKQSMPIATPRQVLLYVSAGLSLWLLMVLYSRDILLGSIVFISLLGLFVSLSLITLAIVRYSGANLRRLFFRYPAGTLAQIAGFSVTLWVIVCIYFLRTEIIENWQDALPPDTPNYFAMNIQPEQTAPFAEKLQRYGIKSQALYPIARGRLIAINDAAISDTPSEETESEGRDESLNRELNLTWANQLPSDNRIVAGHWWDAAPGKSAEIRISVEEKLAERLGIALGDQLVFNFAEQKVPARVTSLRSVKWESMHPNFYVIFEPGGLDNLPITYMTSFFVPEPEKHRLIGFAREFSGVSLVDLEGVMNQVRKVTQQIGGAIEAVMASLLLMGVILLYSSILISLDERSQESALIRAFGGSRLRVSGRIAREFFANGLLAGLMAAVAAELSLMGLSQSVFGLDYQLHPKLWLLLPLTSALAVTLVGAWAAWWLGRVPLNLLLKESAS